MDASLLAASLESSAFGLWMRAGWTYPIANALHLIGLALLLGPIVLIDLRVLGYARELPLGSLTSALTPFVVAGFLIAAISGFALFAADATALVGHRLLWIKLVVIALALINAIMFRLAFNEPANTPPWTARGMALLSILLWTGVLVAGRMIAYV
ncbi:MAG: DUF6644 family protein [Dokdonella sp.]